MPSDPHLYDIIKAREGIAAPPGKLPCSKCGDVLAYSLLSLLWEEGVSGFFCYLCSGQGDGLPLNASALAMELDAAERRRAVYQRDNSVLRMRREGKTYQEIGKAIGMSKQGAYYIVRREANA